MASFGTVYLLTAAATPEDRSHSQNGFKQSHLLLKQPDISYPQTCQTSCPLMQKKTCFSSGGLSLGAVCHKNKKK